MRQIFLAIAAYVVLQLFVPHLWERIVSEAPPVAVKIIVCVAALVCIGFVVFADPVYARLTHPGTYRLSSTAIIVMLLAAITGTAWWQFVVSGDDLTEIPNEGTLREKAYITAKLQIDSIEKNDCKFRVQIKSQDLPVENVQIRFDTDHYHKVEYERMGRMIAPWDTLSLVGSPMVLEPGRDNNLTVRIYFDSMIKGIVRHFIATHSFPLSKDDLKPQVIDPESTSYSEGKAPTYEEQELEFKNALLKVEDSSVFPVEEVFEGKPTIWAMKNDQRFFAFNAEYKRVVFSSKMLDGTQVVMGQPYYPNKRGIHIIKLGWGPNSIFLSVDGVPATDREVMPPSPTPSKEVSPR